MEHGSHSLGIMAMQNTKSANSKTHIHLPFVPEEEVDFLLNSYSK